MKKHFQSSTSTLVRAAIVATVIAISSASWAQYQIVHHFAGPPGDGQNSTASLVIGKDRLYGTTRVGGANIGAQCPVGCGAIFSIGKKGTEAVLHSFDGSRTGGSIPSYGMVKDSAGNFYGVAAGTTGLIYKIDSAGTYSVIYQFSGDPGGDGAGPSGVLARDSAGNLYGTTVIGGGPGHQGTIFKVDPAGKETILYSFTGGVDGADAETGVIRDGGGNLYGSTFSGGQFNCGVIFKLTQLGKYTVLYNFTCGADGRRPQGLLRDSAKNLYGVTDNTVFKLDAAGTLTTLYTFLGAADGGSPKGTLVRDSAGNLYGTTLFGGLGCADSGVGCGVVFKVDPLGNETVLHAFKGFPTDGSLPQAGVIGDGAGHLYGTTLIGGTFSDGIVFKLTP